MFDAFEIAAGYPASDLNLMFRTLFAVIVTLWVAWVAYKQFQLMGDRLEAGAYGANMLKLSFLWAFLMLLVVI